MPEQGNDTDLALIQAIAGGDVPALNELYTRHGANILNYLTSLLHDRPLAEEVLQDVMLAVWENAARFRGDSKVRTWLLSIARNKAINTQRRSTPALVQMDEEFYATDTDAARESRTQDAAADDAGGARTASAVSSGDSRADFLPPAFRR